MQYEIAKDDVISKESLMSMILYTDYSDLCSDFSSTFRNKTKQRHTSYHWMSKLLRETVAIEADIDYERYGMVESVQISKEKLISITLLPDHSDLSSYFTSTFILIYF